MAVFARKEERMASVITTELLGMREGLCIALDCDFMDLIVESDATGVVALVLSECGVLVADILSLATRLGMRLDGERIWLENESPMWIPYLALANLP
ncbi:conserved hypothetical protein [Ricinus communis]|uniref:Uncharacterized protein n=1 Tax=Ricinus communis TaxID=3988 RepID=B9SGC9_RICCO|nr:conserved hypothetical protein [Ricinus communis]